MIRSIYTSFIVISFCILSIAQEVEKPLGYLLGEDIVSFSINGGHSVYYYGLELAIHKTTRLSPSFCYEFKANAGLILGREVGSIGSNDRYLYAGISPAFLFGKNNKFLEIAVGAAYIKEINEDSVPFLNSFIPTVSIGRRTVLNTHSARIGIGFPYIFYVGFMF